MGLTRTEWRVLASRRIQSILRTHTVANMRTLEQKISDAGPNYQRAEPLILTESLKLLERSGLINRRLIKDTPWFHLATASEADIDERLEILIPIYKATQKGAFKSRLGKSLEISVFNAMTQLRKQFLGHYNEMGRPEPDWVKVDPPRTISGHTLEQGKLDFILFDFGGPAGIEVKNYRQWLYPDAIQIRDLIRKSCQLDMIPVLIARRFPYLTFQFLKHAGAVVHQTYNQLYFDEDRALGEQARNKDLLGFHDIRFGTTPDRRLLNFLQNSLPNVLPDARKRFDSLRNLHVAYANQQIPYTQWRKELLVAAGVWADPAPEEAPDDNDPFL